MMITQSQIASRRLALLEEQTTVSKTKCAVCPKRIGRMNMPIEECIGCDALGRAKEIGEELCNLTITMRQLREREQQIERLLNKSLTRITLDEYRALRKVYTDRQLAARYNVLWSDYREWKDILLHGV